MKSKKPDAKHLPKFEAVVLAPEELTNVIGGMMPSTPQTTSTRSKCHVDGMDDLD